LQALNATSLRVLDGSFNPTDLAAGAEPCRAVHRQGSGVAKRLDWLYKSVNPSTP